MFPRNLSNRNYRGYSICARFREMRPRDNWHSVLYSEEPGGAVYVDVIGPVHKGRGGVRYIQCLVDSATRKA